MLEGVSSRRPVGSPPDPPSETCSISPQTFGHRRELTTAGVLTAVPARAAGEHVQSEFLCHSL
jgi:hypothetical protein